MRRFVVAAATLILCATGAWAALEPPEHPLFAGDAVHEIHLTFHQTAWWDSLRANYEGLDDPLYMAAEFDWEGVHFDSIGVRFKGNSSYSYPSDKKSFKLDIDEYVDGQEIDGLDKLNLNNGFLDVSGAREKAFWELAAAAGLPALRANFAALYLNGEYWGLYNLIEQPDQEFIESRFGGGEDGNLFKGDPRGTLEWLGADETIYYQNYELKTNEEENDWSGLVGLIDRLSNTPTGELPDSLSDRLEVHTALGMLALNSLTVNLDSYTGTGHNHYLYEREVDGRFVNIPWDVNEAWGVFSFNMPIYHLRMLPPDWLPTGGPPPGGERPLAAQLWAVPEYESVYEGWLQSLMEGAADPDVLLGRMEELRDLIRSRVYADTNKMYTDSQFDNAMIQDIVLMGSRWVPGLEPFIRGRHNFLQGELGVSGAARGLVINELMAVNEGTLADEFGDYDDWLELTNVGDTSVSLAGITLTDDSAFPGKFALPSMSLEPGEYLLIWCDDEVLEGSLHAPFKLDGDGETLFLYDGGVPLDQAVYPDLPANVSWGRWPDGEGAWRMLSLATPGAENQNPEEPEDLVLFVNEFLAKNVTVNQDEAGEYDDWVEIYNPGPDVVEMAGLFLTDDLAQSTKWSFPDTALAAGGFLLVWCDEDGSQGPLHANFKLSADGEQIALFGRLAAGNEIIDYCVFGPQLDDVSYGRESDGGEPWVYFTEPTPGESNSDSSGTEEQAPPAVALLGNYPNPFNPTTRIDFELPEAVRVRLEIFDARGRRVCTLLDEWREPGRHEIDWTGRDDGGSELSSGLYFYRLSAPGCTLTRKMVLLR